MLKKAVKGLKHIDIFKQPAFSFSTNRNKLTNEKKFAEFHGSILGGIVSLFFMTITFWYIYGLFVDMLAGNNDNKNTELNNNPMNEITNTENLMNSTFYPNLHLEISSDDFYKFFDDDEHTQNNN